MPTNIFKIINDNILDIAKDLNSMHQKIDALYTVFYQSENNDVVPTEKPKTDGDTPAQV